jgi:hypothetical protein
MLDALAPLRERFQFVVLDCPPALDLLTLNALVAADSVLIPMQAEYFALEGVSELLDTVDRIRQSFNPLLEIEGVVLTMFDERTNLAQQVASELRKYFGKKLCRTSIPRNVRLAEAPSHGKPALIYDVRSRGAESYIRLAKEILGAEARRRREAVAASQLAAASPQPVTAPEPVPAEAATAIAAIEAAPEPIEAIVSQHEAGTPMQSVSQSEPPAETAAEPIPVSTPIDEVATAGVSPGESTNAHLGSGVATEAQPEVAAGVASEPALSPPEAYPSLPAPAIADAVIQSTQAPEAQPAVEQGD